MLKLGLYRRSLHSYTNLLCKYGEIQSPFPIAVRLISTPSMPWRFQHISQEWELISSLLQKDRCFMCWEQVIVTMSFRIRVLISMLRP